MGGADEKGKELVNCEELDTELVRVVPDGRSATYTAVLDCNGECRLGVGDMEIHSRITPHYVQGLHQEIMTAPLVVADGNLSQETLHTLLDMCSTHKVPLFFEPTDLRKANLPLSSPSVSAMTYCSPNLNELNSMLSYLTGVHTQLPKVTLDNAKETVLEVGAAAAKLVEEYGLSVVLVTLSECGVIVVRRGQPTDPLPRKGSLSSSSGSSVSGVWYPGQPCSPDSVVSVSGAGDCLTAGFITGLLHGESQECAISLGLQAASLSCGVAAAVPDILTVTWSQHSPGIRIL